MKGEALDPQNPLRLDIDYESTDGTRLTVRGRVRAETAVQLDKIVLHLTSLKDGEKTGEAYYPLVAAKEDVGMQGVLPKGGEVPFSMSVSAEGMSDYQLELLWGEDAVAYLSSLAAETKRSAPGIAVEEIRMSPAECDDPGCKEKSYVTAILRNGSDQMLKELRLGLSLGGGEENEIAVTDVNLGPGSVQPLRLELEVPYAIGANMSPALRVIDASLVAE